ncbi:hypothetical protein [Variovorax sp. UMC13]|uniref:hypothetical protein n=1 Tax=Variovorax sp. UMC13 TaxID=1862326 RepID=UPI0016041337|nr:hypothetical protein [Variovorax sp. UMC13]MBB1602288.1 hypothetical protein [Variovorax sp. UMC13]
MKPVKTPEKSGAPRKSSRASERLDALDRLEAASLLRTDETFLRCGGPRPMKPRRHMAKKGPPKR